MQRYIVFRHTGPIIWLLLATWLGILAAVEPSHATFDASRATTVAAALSGTTTAPLAPPDGCWGCH